MDEQAGGCANVVTDEQTGGETGGWVGGKRTYGRTNGHTVGRTDRRSDRQTDGRTDGEKNSFDPKQFRRDQSSVYPRRIASHTSQLQFNA